MSWQPQPWDHVPIKALPFFHITSDRKLDWGLGMRLCHYGNSVTAKFIIACRFVFPNGANHSGIPLGYWRMDIYARWGSEENSTLFRRMRPNPNLYYPFAIPRGDSYACSKNNSLNEYTVYGQNNDTESMSSESSPIKALHLPGIQVSYLLYFMYVTRLP